MPLQPTPPRRPGPRGPARGVNGRRSEGGQAGLGGDAATFHGPEARRSGARPNLGCRLDPRAFNDSSCARWIELVVGAHRHLGPHSRLSADQVVWLKLAASLSRSSFATTESVSSAIWWSLGYRGRQRPSHDYTAHREDDQASRDNRRRGYSPGGATSQTGHDCDVDRSHHVAQSSARVGRSGR